MATKVSNGLDLQNQRIQNIADPSSAQDVASKNYVDATIRGVDWKASVKAASTGNITLTAPGASIDNVTMVSGDRFLAKDQTTASQNGIYVWNGASSAATRATDANTNAQVTAGMSTTSTEGTSNADKVWLLTTNDPITLDSTSLAFTQVGSGGGGTTYTAGNGLNLSGGAFSVNAGTGIVADGTSTRIDTSVVPRKYAASIGDGSATAITVTHNLGTRDVTVQVYASASPWDQIIADVTLPTANTAVIAFATAPASGAFRAVITG